MPRLLRYLPTAQRYCDELIGDHDDEFMKILREGLSLEALTQRVCYQMVQGAQACLSNVP